MEYLTDLKILADSSSKDDYVGTYTFFKPTLPQPTATPAARPFSRFIYEEDCIRLDSGTTLEEYFKK